MPAVTLETVRNVALIATVAVVVLGVALALVVKAVLGKLVIIAVVVGLGLVVWTNRTNVTDCVGRVQQAIADGGQPASCTFMGIDVDVPVP